MVTPGGAERGPQEVQAAGHQQEHEQADGQEAHRAPPAPPRRRPWS